MNSQPSRLPLLHRLTHGWPLLLSGGVLLATSNGRWILPLGVWLAPVLLMRYVRDARRAWLALVLLWLTLFFGMAIAWLGLWPFPPKVFMQMVAMSALWATLPYAIDRLTLRRAPPLAQSFPPASSQWITWFPCIQEPPGATLPIPSQRICRCCSLRLSAACGASDS